MSPFAKARSIANKFRPTDLRGSAPRPVVARLLGLEPGARPRGKAEEKASPAVGELFIYEQIGFDCWTGEGVTGKSVADALATMKGVKTLNIFVNSEGGDVFEAKAIYTNLKRFDAEKVIHIDGIAASAATFIAMAGDRIITSPVATWMVHEAWSGAMGRAQDMRAMADLLELENRTIAETYARQTGGSVEEMEALMAAPPDGTWMNAATALELGFTDEIGEDEAEDEELEPAATSARSAVSGAIALTQSRLKSLSPGQLMTARAAMRRPREFSGQPEKK